MWRSAVGVSTESLKQEEDNKCYLIDGKSKGYAWWSDRPYLQPVVKAKDARQSGRVKGILNAPQKLKDKNPKLLNTDKNPNNTVLKRLVLKIKN